jgi:hypothetical protein
MGGLYLLIGLSQVSAVGVFYKFFEGSNNYIGDSSILFCRLSFGSLPQ